MSRAKWMHKKRVWKTNFWGSHKLPQAHKKCAMKMKVARRIRIRKKLHVCKNVSWKESIYKICTENSCHGYQPASDQWLLIQWRYYLFSKWVNGCQGDGFSSVGT